MNWNSFEEFFHMGGAGLYVWGSYLVTLLLMVCEPLLARARHRDAKTHIAELHSEKVNSL